MVATHAIRRVQGLGIGDAAILLQHLQRAMVPGQLIERGLFGIGLDSDDVRLVHDASAMTAHQFTHRGQRRRRRQ
jgi:hypothetical protein